MKRWLHTVVATLLLVILGVWPALAASPGAPPEGLVPLRMVAEAAGARVDWDEASQSITITTREGIEVTLRVGQAVANNAGRLVPVGGTVQLVNGRTMINPAFLKSLLGLPVEYDPVTDTAAIDPQVEEALAFVKAMPAGTAEAFFDRFTPGLQAALSREKLPTLVGALAPLGQPGRVVVVGHTHNAVHESVELLAQFDRAVMQVFVRYDANGLIDDLFMSPSPQVPSAPAPDYADPETFTEEDVVVGEAPWALPGTLSLPVGEGPFPVVVLVHGSGPNDRDESVGGVKPFRDLAHGLASRGIAVLRYEKRTREHSQKFGVTPNFTIQEESIDDALAAIRLVSGDSRLDPERVYVLGHSLGGIAVPRIIQQDADGLLKGGILMAGTNSFFAALLQQNKYAVQNGEAPPQQVPFIEAQIAMLTDPAFDPAQPPEGYLLGTPYYWHDLVPKSSDLLKEQTQPLLILQGERDWQVPASELESFQADLAGRESVTYKLYPKLNHVFTEGEGEISTTKEYFVQANLPLYVIEDIAGWILQ